MHPKPSPRRIAPIILILIVLASLAYWYFAVRPAQADGGALSASGTLEITQIQISPEIGGKVIAVNVEEGDPVKAGQTLVQIDISTLRAQRAQAEAAIDIAKANERAALKNTDAAKFTTDAAMSSLDAAASSLQLLEAGATAEQIAAAQAQLTQAEAGYQAAAASFAVLTAGARPEEVAAARLRLDTARQVYYGMTVSLSESQVEAVKTALATAQANLEAAKARLDELKKDNDTPPEAIKAAEDNLNDAQAALTAAQAALDAVQDAALPFYRQIQAARQSWDVAELNLAQASARRRLLLGVSGMPQTALDAAGAAEEDAGQMLNDAKAAYEALDASPQGSQLDAAWNEVTASLAALSSLARSASIPVETSLSQIDAAVALVEIARANLTALQNGSRSEQIEAARSQVAVAKVQVLAAEARAAAAKEQAAAAQAQVKAAQAALAAIDVQIGKLTITAPIDGVVLTRIIQPGEVAAPGATLLVIGNMADKTITVYIPEDRYGLLSLGQSALVSVDSFPGVSFTAEVIHIAGQAEFTPRNVQTVAGRKNTVFAIKLRVADPDDRLKPGMPADVVFNK